MHHLAPGPDTVHWGYFDAALSPRLTIDSGERVTISSVSGGPELMPAPPLVVPPELPAIHAKHAPKLGPHILTGPVAVKGAKPGQVLQVDIEAIDCFYDWGYNSVRPLMGALPDDFPEKRNIHIVLDRAKKSWLLPWGQEIPLAPFFGVMGTAPPAAWGMLSRLESLSRGEARMLEPGDKAPDFTVQDHTGKTQKLSDYRGRSVVLWFYPKADTPG